MESQYLVAVAKEFCTDFEPPQRRCATQIARMNVKIPTAGGLEEI
jgi:hypothetical protein